MENFNSLIDLELFDEGILSLFHKLLLLESQTEEKLKQKDWFSTLDGIRPVSNYQSRSNKKGLRVNTTLEMVRSIPGVGMGVGIEVIKVFPTMMELTEASLSELAVVPKVGKGRAEIIFNALRGKTC